MQWKTYLLGDEVELCHVKYGVQIQFFDTKFHLNK